MKLIVVLYLALYAMAAGGEVINFTLGFDYVNINNNEPSQLKDEVLSPDFLDRFSFWLGVSDEERKTIATSIHVTAENVKNDKGWSMELNCSPKNERVLKWTTCAEEFAANYIKLRALGLSPNLSMDALTQDKGEKTDEEENSNADDSELNEIVEKYGLPKHAFVSLDTKFLDYYLRVKEETQPGRVWAILDGELAILFWVDGCRSLDRKLVTDPNLIAWLNLNKIEIDQVEQELKRDWGLENAPEIVLSEVWLRWAAIFHFCQKHHVNLMINKSNVDADFSLLIDHSLGSDIEYLRSEALENQSK